jgi:hypothetical protein
VVVHYSKKVLRIVGGFLVIVIGIGLSLPGIPGPGIAVVVLGLSILSTDFVFARRAMDWLKGLARRTLHRRNRGPAA